MLEDPKQWPGWYKHSPPSLTTTNIYPPARSGSPKEEEIENIATQPLAERGSPREETSTNNVLMKPVTIYGELVTTSPVDPNKGIGEESLLSYEDKDFKDLLDEIRNGSLFDEPNQQLSDA